MKPYEDLDLMPFGLYKAKPLQDVPAKYLLWLWDQRPLSDRRLEKYIERSMDALRQDVPDYLRLPRPRAPRR